MISIFKWIKNLFRSKTKEEILQSLNNILDGQIRIEEKLEFLKENGGAKLITRFIQDIRVEFRDSVNVINKRNSELTSLLTKYFELEKMKVERESVKQEENKPTEDDKRF